MVPNVVLRGEVGPDGTRLSPSARLLYAVILDYARAGDRPCTAAQASLARDLNVSPRQVRNLLGELTLAGLISVQRRGQGATNIIKPLLLPDRKRTSDQVSKPASAKEDLHQTNNANDNCITDEKTSGDNRQEARA